MERPTVPIAEVVSNKISRNPADSITETAIVPIIKIVKDISITEIPVRIFSSGILLPKHSVSLFPFTTVTAVRNNIAIVVVFTPPAVPAGEPPINIRRQEMNTDSSLRSPCGTVKNPAVLVVTD